VVVELGSRVGVEVELLAPRGATRADVAGAIAEAAGGGVRPRFHRDSEPSAVPGMTAFRHLTRGFDVTAADGTPLCSVVDDVTLVTDLDRRAPPLPGWHRVVTDDPRLLNLAARVCDPAAGLAEVLEPVARLFGTRVTRTGAVHRVADADGASVAMAAPLPGERHRPAEIITPPLVEGHGEALERLLGPARRLGCTVPAEAAVHLHFDAAPFRAPAAFAEVVALFEGWRDALWRLFGTNRACRRLAPPPAALVDLVPVLRGLRTWDEARAALDGVELSKYSDVNLLHVVRAPAVRDTLEVRILPGSADAPTILRQAAVVEGLLERCRAGGPVPRPSGRTEQDAAVLARWGRKEW
jgi:hypothetical protein